jgi:hypothetical protein
VRAREFVKEEQLDEFLPAVAAGLARGAAAVGRGIGTAAGAVGRAAGTIGRTVGSATSKIGQAAGQAAGTAFGTAAGQAAGTAAGQAVGQAVGTVGGTKSGLTVPPGREAEIDKKQQQIKQLQQASTDSMTALDNITAQIQSLKQQIASQKSQ